MNILEKNDERNICFEDKEDFLYVIDAHSSPAHNILITIILLIVFVVQFVEINNLKTFY